MSLTSDIKVVSYLCGECKQTRRLSIDKDVHLQRRELTINGLASYIDVHADKKGMSRHGIKIFIDKNFHVRTNNVLKIKKSASVTSGPSIPLPGFKTKSLTTTYTWHNWSSLELEIKSENLKFKLEITELDEDAANKINSKITTVSELGSVVCNLDALVEEETPEILVYISGWMASFCNSMELASAMHVDLIPEVLRYIDIHVHRPITYSDEMIIAILIDKSSLLIPNKDALRMIAEKGPAMELMGLNPDKLKKIAMDLVKYDSFSMIDIQKILEHEIEKDSELEEEFIVLALFYLISLDAFDYKLSYLQTVKGKNEVPEESYNAN